jgi:DNA topoisomerase-2
LSSILGRQLFGYFPLRGKPLNVHGTPIGKIAANEELKNVMTILGLDISKLVTDMTYENVLISTDADLDGQLIRGGLLAFFNRFTPELIKQGRIKFLSTPIMYTKGKNGFPDKWIYDMREASALKGNVFYSKGLGSWLKKDLQYIIEKDGLENMIQTFSFDDKSDFSIDLWMGNDADARKDQLEGKYFLYESL